MLRVRGSRLGLFRPSLDGGFALLELSTQSRRSSSAIRASNGSRVSFSAEFSARRRAFSSSNAAISAALIASGGLESGDASSVAVMQDLDSSPSPSVNQFPAQPYLGSYRKHLIGNGSRPPRRQSAVRGPPSAG